MERPGLQQIAAAIRGLKRARSETHANGSANRVASFALIVSAISAAFTGYLAFTARDTETTQLRAYLGIKMGPIVCPDCAAGVGQQTSSPTIIQPALPNTVEEVALGTPKNYVQITLTNAGQTPAYRTGAVICFQLEPLGQPLPSDFKYDGCKVDHTTSSTVFPDSPATSWVSAKTPTDFGTAQRREQRLFAYGTVTYYDVFQQERHTPVCFWYAPEDAGKQNAAWVECDPHTGQRTD